MSYLKNLADDESVHTSYNLASALLGRMDVVAHLANIITPNLDTSK